MPLWARIVGSAFVVLALGVLAFATFEPIQVLPRIRLAPGFAMVDQAGAPYTSDLSRGRVVLYGFAYGGCGEACDTIRQTMAEVSRRVESEVDMGDVALDLVTVTFDAARDANRLSDLADAWGADGDRWRWAAVSDLEAQRTVLGQGFGLYYQELGDGSFAFDPRFVLVDGWGVVRGEYRYSTLADDADKITRHIGLLGEELRNSNGVTSFAYEAAHVFLCYP